MLSVTVGATLLSFLVVAPASAQGTAWLAEPGTGSVTISYGNQNSTAHYVGTDKVEDPFDLAQNTMWFGVNYVISDSVSLDVQSAWARSFITNAAGPSGGMVNYDGLFDSNVALTWRIVDELVSDAPSVAVRLGAIVPGSYDTGYINSLGDGGAGVEASVIVGKFGSVAGVQAEVGYRNRASTEVNTMAIGGGAGETVDIPADMFVNLGLFIPAGDIVTLAVDYQVVNAFDGLQIGGEGFSPARFPGLEEDIQLVGGRVIVDVADTISLSGYYGQVVTGRNTAASRVLGVGVTFGFGFGGVGF